MWNNNKQNDNRNNSFSNEQLKAKEGIDVRLLAEYQKELIELVNLLTQFGEDSFEVQSCLGRVAALRRSLFTSSVD